MSTLRQKKLAKMVLENPKLMEDGKKGKLVAMGGYNESIVRHPERVLGSKGFNQELEKYGLTDELITTSLVSDIKAKPKKRLGELNLAAEMKGLKARPYETKDRATNIVIVIGRDKLDRIRTRRSAEIVEG